MPLVTDLTVVRSLLNREPAWAAYAIGDLASGFVEHCEWFATGENGSSLLLVYRGFHPPIVVAMGPAIELRTLFSEITAAIISLHVRPEALAAMDGIYLPTNARRMRRMVLHPDAFRPVCHSDVQRLGEDDLASIATLYEDGHRRVEGPTFFHPAMLRQGTFHGLWANGALVSIAGTHLYAPSLGVCAIGNVYTHSEHRGRGLAARVTSAVVAHARQDRVATIVLNVGEDNLSAQRLYERLGFEHYCDFLEGEATRITGDPRSHACL